MDTHALDDLMCFRLGVIDKVAERLVADTQGNLFWLCLSERRKDMSVLSNFKITHQQRLRCTRNESEQNN